MARLGAPRARDRSGRPGTPLPDGVMPRTGPGCLSAPLAAPPTVAAMADLAELEEVQPFLQGIGREALLTGEEELELARQDRARRPRRQGAHDQREPAPRRVDRQALQGPGDALQRPDPGGHDRAHQGRGEVRPPPWLQVLDLRHLVDPAGDRARPRREVAHGSDPRARGAADEGDRPRRAQAGARAWPRPPARRDRRGRQPHGRGGGGRPSVGPDAGVPRATGRRGGRRGAPRPDPRRRGGDAARPRGRRPLALDALREALESLPYQGPADRGAAARPLGRARRGRSTRWRGHSG